VNAEQWTLVVMVGVGIVWVGGAWHFALIERAKHVAKQRKRKADREARSEANRQAWIERFGNADLFFDPGDSWYISGTWTSPDYGFAALWPVAYPARALFRLTQRRALRRSDALAEQYLREMYADEITANIATAAGDD
jgi:hypothetical protein